MADRWFSPGTPVSSTTKINEIYKTNIYTCSIYSIDSTVHMHEIVKKRNTHVNAKTTKSKQSL